MDIYQSKQPVRLTQTTKRAGATMCSVLLLTIALILCLSANASAQIFNVPREPNPIPPKVPSITSFLYSMKFVCGNADRLNDVQSTGDPVSSPYEDFQPGRYATAINILNRTSNARSVTVVAAAVGLVPNQVINTLSLAPFETKRIGCLDIMPAIESAFQFPNFPGNLIEGFAYFTQGQDALDVEVVYSYSSQDTNGAGLEGSGGGGVGASLDVVEVEAREVDGLILQLR